MTSTRPSPLLGAPGASSVPSCTPPGLQVADTRSEASVRICSVRPTAQVTQPKEVVESNVYVEIQA